MGDTTNFNTLTESARTMAKTQNSNKCKLTGEHASVIYGTHYPCRLFVGCLPPEAGAEDLGSFFSTYGNVVEAKIVLDHGGNSKRFGFVTFTNPEEVESLIACGDIHFKGKKINVGPAVKKNARNGGSADEAEETAASTKVPVSRESKTKPPPLNIPASISTHKSQHMPKTVIRSCPWEDSQKANNNPEDKSFKYIWGITSKPTSSSVWSPYHGNNKYAASNPVGKSSTHETGNYHNHNTSNNPTPNNNHQNYGHQNYVTHNNQVSESNHVNHHNNHNNHNHNQFNHNHNHASLNKHTHNNHNYVSHNNHVNNHINGNLNNHTGFNDFNPGNAYDQVKQNIKQNIHYNYNQHYNHAHKNGGGVNHNQNISDSLAALMINDDSYQGLSHHGSNFSNLCVGSGLSNGGSQLSSLCSSPTSLCTPPKVRTPPGFPAKSVLFKSK